jgi:hypothetical protein
MPLNQITVNNPANTNIQDASTVTATGDRQGATLVNEVHGKYYTSNYRGAGYWAANAPTGGSLVIYSTSAGAVTGLGLWNPTGSGKNAALTRAIATPVTAGGTASALGFSIYQNVGANVGTAAPISAFTAVTATRGQGLLNNATGQGSSVCIATSSATVTTASTIWRPAPYTISTAASTAVLPSYIEDFDGQMIVQPGVFIAFTVAIASTGTWNLALHWEEAPV